MTFAGSCVLKSLEIEVGGERRNVAAGKIRHVFRFVAQARKAEERGGRLLKRRADRAKSLFNFVFGLRGIELGQIGMRPCMRSDGMSGRSDVAKQGRMPKGMLADREEDRLRALIAQRLENCWCVARPGTIVKSQYDFAGPQKIVGLELFRPEARSARGVDLDNARNAESILIGRTCGGSFVGPRRGDEKRDCERNHAGTDGAHRLSALVR